MIGSAVEQGLRPLRLIPLQTGWTVAVPPTYRRSTVHSIVTETVQYNIEVVCNTVASRMAKWPLVAEGQSRFKDDKSLETIDVLGILVSVLTWHIRFQRSAGSTDVRG
jgi:hypothetical protein